MAKDVISVIVPVYNVEKYLQEAVSSIQRQTYKNLEIILVDDGSTDSSSRICDVLAENDKRIKVFHQKNAGYGVACNKGLAVASGKYVAIMEPDDWIEPTMYEKMHDKAEKLNLDIVKAGFYYIENDKGQKRECKYWGSITDKEVFALSDAPKMILYFASLWSCLYRRDFLTDNHIKMEETPSASYQDYSWMALTYANAKRISILNEPLYNYRRMPNQNSSSNQYGERCFMMIEHCKIAEKILVEAQLLRQVSEEFYVHSFRNCLMFLKGINDNLKKEYFLQFCDFMKSSGQYNFKGVYFTPDEKKVFSALSSRDFLGVFKILKISLPKKLKYEQYSASSFLGVPVLEKLKRNNEIKKKFFGITYYSRFNTRGVNKRKFLFGLLKIRKMPSYKKIYLCGVQVYVKKLRKSPADTVLAANRSAYNFIHYNKLAELLHPQIFLKYKDINKGQDVVLFACGPTANFFEKIPNCKYVGINRALYNAKIKFSQLFMHDDEFIRENEELLKNYDAEKFCAFHTNEKNAKEFNTVTERLKVIQAHRFIISDPGRGYVGTSVPDVINPDISKGMLYDRGGGTVFSALQFILYTHPKRIYLVGCDCTSEGYFYSLKNNKGPIPAYWTDPRQGKNILLSKLKKLWLEASYVLQDMYPDIEIISVNPVALKGLFKDVYTQSYLDEHPELVGEQVEILTGEAANG